MPILKTYAGANVPVKVWTDEVEADAIQQLKNVAALPIVVGHIAAMPDVHLGIGATVGSVIATRGAVIPAAVGVDIGCGMNAIRTSLCAADLPDTLARLRSAIESAVPVGFEQHEWDKVRGHWKAGWNASSPSIRGWPRCSASSRRPGSARSAAWAAEITLSSCAWMRNSAYG